MLSGKVAVVTGAGKGIGRVTAVELAKAGATVVLVGDRQEPIEELNRHIAELRLRSMAVVADVSKFRAVARMAKRVKDACGRIDILVNNAGISSVGAASWHMPVLEIDDNEWDGILAVNLKGPFNCAKAVIPYMIAQKGGTIVNVSSTTALAPAFGSAPYCASKAGVMALTRVLAKELGGYNIRVNCVAPGLTITPAHDSTPETEIDTLTGSVPLGRAAMPSDIARAILMFASDGFFATGQTLVVDGGAAMH
jgi:3-oxoacyl-[acyl-carrier protein] reductase